MSKIVAVFGASRPAPGEAEYAEALRCGALLAQRGLTVLTGGYDGVMEAASRGAAEAGGKTMAITAPEVFPQRPGANPWVHDERHEDTISRRIATLLDLADAVIVLPGSIGTFTELVAAWNTAFVARFSSNKPLPIVAVGETWRELIRHIAGVVETDPSIVDTVADVDEAAQMVAELLAARGVDPA